MVPLSGHRDQSVKNVPGQHREIIGVSLSELAGGMSISTYIRMS